MNRLERVKETKKRSKAKDALFVAIRWLTAILLVTVIGGIVIVLSYSGANK
jgi:cell division septal protein FtsQ